MRRGLLTGVLAAGALLVGSAPALASPFWSVTTRTVPSNLAPGGSGEIAVRATNLGDDTADGAGEPIRISDKLPPGLTATAISSGKERLFQKGAETRAKCDLASLSCVYSAPVEPFEELPEVFILVSVAGGATSGLVNEASVSGGGAHTVTVTKPVTVSTSPSSFGVEELAFAALNEEGSVDTQAGSHPFEFTTTIALNDVVATGPDSFHADGLNFFGGLEESPVGMVKDLSFELPPGLIGNPQVVPQCTGEEFGTIAGEGTEANLCPANTAIGIATVNIQLAGGRVSTVPLFNMVPSVGEPARFAFDAAGVKVFLDTSLRTGGDYGVVVHVNNITQQAGLDASQVTFWGVPADPRHDLSRGWDCIESGQFGVGGCEPSGQQVQTPFLTLPPSCTGPLRMTVKADSWEERGVIRSGESTFNEPGGVPLGMDGCTHLPFSPTISVAPDGLAASTPTGLTVGVHVPQQNSLNATGLTEADVRNTTVTLPAGVQLSPSAADGLLACSDAQVGYEGFEAATQTQRFSSGPVSCPEASKVATVEIKTPLLPEALEGAVYLAAQNANPFGSLVAMYIVAEDKQAGVLVKLPGQVALDPVTGQLVATFQNTPQLPFEDLKLHFFGSARAPLSTPPLCGMYTTQASIAPWSGNAPAEPSSSFQITSGPNGVACSDPQPFTPGFESGSTNLQASAFTPFELTMSRPDADQTLSRVELQMPPGLLGTLSAVKLCPEPQAAQGTCGAESLIGETVVSAGLGGDPYTVTGGKVYITTGYKGAPYGLSIVNPAVAGPFNLGTVVVRATINVDPHTAALKIVSDPLPTILDGIPLQIQHVQVSINRPNFTFNPSNCGKLAITGTLSSTEGSTAAVSTPFQVTNCATLAFRPVFAVSTSGKTSKADGASLHVKLTYPTGPYDANIAKVKVDLPKQLPSRLTTLQKACTAAVFNANPANCPAASLIGSATATTPVLPVSLSGPVYFVSHGGEAFPSLIVVLQGYGTTVDLEGSTFISKAGITSSTFKTVPDVPVGTFELTLPEGKYSALAANGNLCKAKLAMPTEFVAQNGIEIHESTKITTTGCPKTKKAKTHKKKKNKSQAKKARSS
jgi:hypothetical protein